MHGRVKKIDACIRPCSHTPKWNRLRTLYILTQMTPSSALAYMVLITSFAERI